MKSERIEFKAAPGLKIRLQSEAATQGISVGELIRQRFEPSPDEQELVAVTQDLRQRTQDAAQALAAALQEVDTLVAELRARRGETAQIAA